MKQRKDIEEKYKWDLTKFYANDDEFFKSLKKFSGYKDEIAKFEGKLFDDETLLKCLEFETKVSKEAERLGVYASVKLSEDVRDSKINELNEMLETVFTEYSMASSFVSVEMSSFTEKRLKALMEDKRFSDHEKTLYHILRDKKHVLSKKEEKLLSGMSFLGGFSENFDKFDDGDLKFKKVKNSHGKEYELTHSTYRILSESKDETLRKNTFKEFNGAYGRNINFLSANYISDVKADCYFAKARGYKSALSASIFHEQASEKVYKMLINQVHKNIDVFYDYMEIKRKMLNQKTISISDCFAHVVKPATKSYSYEQAIELIKQAVSPLGKEYQCLIQRAKDERWIDVFPSEGKDSGAYSTHAYGVTPLVLMNFKGDLDSVFTLAHELGHAMHSYFSMNNQKYETADYVIFVAEVASTTNEMLLLRHLLKNAKTTNEKLFLFDKLFSEVKSTIFRQTMFSEFEEKVHAMHEENEPLSKDKLCNLYLDLNKFYFGKKVKIWDEVKYEWARIPHFFRPFYVYKYGTGLICALNFSEKLFENEKGAREKYFGFLSAGSSSSPIKILQDAGCNLEEQKSFEFVFDFLREVLKEWKAILK